jgi:serine/threonine-protein kinase
MSPGQARGKSVDKRTDIWAFGCCLYEALTGKAAFLGETVSDTMAAILKQEPDWAALPEEAPPILRRLLERFLNKSIHERFHDIADFRFILEDGVGKAEVVEVERRDWLPWLVSAAAIVVALIALVALWPSGSDVTPNPVRMSISIPQEQLLLTGSTVIPALSPDGSRLVYSAIHEGRRGLFLREFDQDDIVAIPGGEEGHVPFFSPDGEWLGFSAGGKLKKVRLDGSGAPPVELPGSPANRGASWGPDGTIV